MEKRDQVTITGGSGHLGTVLVNQLLDLGYKIKAQHNTFTPPISHPNLRWIKCDITNANAVANLITECDFVIHCAGLISIGTKTHDEIYKVNVTGTENVLRACESVPNIRLIHISSSNAVQEHSENGFFTEDQPYKIASDFSYPYTKALAEKLVLRSVSTNKLDAIILRPSSIVGAPDYRPSLMGQTILDFSVRKFPVLTTGGYNIVDIRDVAQSIINGFEKGNTGQIYLLSGTYIPIKELAKMANPLYTPLLIPINVLLGLMPIINMYRKLFGLDLPITKESLLTLKYAPKKMDCTKAKNNLNHNPRPISITITDVISWFHHNSKK